MIRILPKKLPSDLTQPRGIGFSLPINGSNVFNSVYDSKEQIKYNLINYLLTNWGERVFNYNFGANLRALLFEGIKFNELSNLETQIKNNIKQYFPMVNVVKLELTPYPDQNMVIFTFKYKMEAYNIEDEIEISIV